MMYKSITFSICLLVHLVNASAQTIPNSKDYFEGVIIYKSDYLDSTGNKLPFFINEEEVLHDKYHIVNRVLKGEALVLIGDKAIYLNGEDSTAYSIDYGNKVIRKLNSQTPEIITPIEFKKIGESSVLNYMCDIYFIKYVHRMDYMEKFALPGFEPSMLSSTYYISRDLKILNPKTFSALQGNHNTEILDGRFTGIPLKIIVKSSSGTKNIIEATRVESKDMRDRIKLPDYPIQN